MRNVRFALLLAKLKLARMMAFRVDFFGVFFVDAAFFGMQLLMFSAIYSQVDSIGGWGPGEMLIFVGTFSLLDAINMSIYFFGILDIPRKIAEGDLDHYITKPVNPLFRITFENINPGSVPLIFLSLSIVVYGVSQLNRPVTGNAVLIYGVLVILMELLYYDLAVILRTVSFFTLSATAMTEMESWLLPMNMKLPGIVYKGFFKVLFYFFLPYGVMATIPTEVLAGTATRAGLAYGVCIVIVFTGFMMWFWTFGLRHYKSSGN